MAEHRRGDRTADVRAGLIAGVLAGLLLMVLAVGSLVHALANGWDVPLSGPAVAQIDLRIPEPRLESAPQYEFDRHAARKEPPLERYEWIDRDRGLARIPVEAAIELLAAAARAHSSKGGRP